MLKTLFSKVYDQQIAIQNWELRVRLEKTHNCLFAFVQENAVGFSFTHSKQVLEEEGQFAHPLFVKGI